jgi:DNA primase
MGAVLYEPQRCTLLRRFHQVLLMLDGDVAGRKATKIIAAKLRPRCPVHVVELPISVQADQCRCRRSARSWRLQSSTIIASVTSLNEAIRQGVLIVADHGVRIVIGRWRGVHS